tara:strand:+ start:866 stop:997 length:132 start_codon:yes stop_codon:yes gene_type:complete
MGLELVIFDVYGVLVDSGLMQFNAFNEVFGRYAVVMTAEDYWK